jgi:hypothetical protein
MARSASLERKSFMLLTLSATARRRPERKMILAPGLFAILLCGVAPAPTARAAEQAITMDGMARSVSLMEAIAGICSPYGADAELAGRAAKAFIAAGMDAYGAATFTSALRRERARRRQEIVSSSAAGWCEEQKEKQARTGVSGVFPSK